MTAFDLQLDPAAPGMSFHKLDRARDKNFWSVRVSQDIRLIVHRTPQSLLLAYVDHHDKAYAWAERRKLETHPSTGAAQLVEIRERVEEILVPAFVSAPIRPAPRASGPPVFTGMSDADLMECGVPAEWLADVRLATEDTLLTLADHLPAEAAEALLELATGGQPRKPEPATATPDPFEHPDAQRRFRVVADIEDLERALEFPWDRWTVFLHPAQRELIERRFGGPARISGSAGTGKTVVALHRAVHLARTNADARVLLTTFSDTLANSLRIMLGRLSGTEPRLRERIDVESVDAVARRLHDRMEGPVAVASPELVRDIVSEAAAHQADQKFALSFVTSEWNEVVDAWQLDTWDAYRDVARLGRKTRLPEKQRQLLWEIFAQVRSELGKRKVLTPAQRYSRLVSRLVQDGHSPYDFIVVDEAQDLSVAQLTFLSALGAGREDALFFAGDLGQRIFQIPFSWRSLGVDIRGRSTTLRVNYRTSHQIRAQADRLLGAFVTDVDGNIEERAATVSVFNGAEPTVRVLPDPDEECKSVSSWLRDRVNEGVLPGEIGVFVRSPDEMLRAEAAVQAAGLPVAWLDEGVQTARDRAVVGIMHLSKGLEFRSVVVMACDDEVLPLQSRIEAVTDDGDLEDVYETERHLLYVACTRARDHLLVTGVGPGSEFLEDLLR